MLRVLPAVQKRVVEEGVQYGEAYVTTPLCCPSRASILTGQYAHNHGVTDNAHPEALDPSTTLVAALRAAGYRTGLFGKYLNGWPLKDAPPRFDRWAMAHQEGYYYGTHFNVNGEIRTVEEYSTDFISRRLLRFIETSEAADDRPWFAYVTPLSPHLPAAPARKYEDTWVPRFRPSPGVLEKDVSDKPPYVRRVEPPRIGWLKWIYRKMLRSLLSVNDLVRRTFQSLALHGEENTIAFFVSDNGFMLGEHHLTFKSAPYSRSVRVPMLMRWPGRVTPARVDTLVLNIDIAPTVYAATGVTPPIILDGRSLLDTPTRTYALLEGYGSSRFRVPPWRSLRAPEWQYTRYYRDDGTTSFIEYYDHEVDPWQLENQPAPPEMAPLLASVAQCAGESCP
jgi:arylsulfatase A-like enzyme